MACLVVYPFFLAIWFSLSDAMIGEPGQWVGLANFMYLFGIMYEGEDLPWYLKFRGFSWDLSLADDIFLLTLRNTLLFAIFSVVLKGVFGLGAALLMQRATKMKRFIRGSILVPFVAPTVLTTLGWWLILDPTYSHINWLLENLWPLNLLGLGPYQWLGNPNLALSSVIFVNFWRGMPFFAVTMFAGLVVHSGAALRSCGDRRRLHAAQILARDAAAAAAGHGRGRSLFHHFHLGRLRNCVRADARGTDELHPSLCHLFVHGRHSQSGDRPRGGHFLSSCSPSCCWW